jgi:hypothetical protein
MTVALEPAGLKNRSEIDNGPDRANRPKRALASNEMTDTYELEFFAEDDGTKPVLAWIKNDLTATQRRALGAAMRHVLQVNGVHVCSTTWGRPLGGGLFEFRVRRTGAQMINIGWAKRSGINSSERILLRVFCHAHGDKLILLLGGYDKGSTPGKSKQASQIALARRRLRTHHARRAAQHKKPKH